MRNDRLTLHYRELHRSYSLLISVLTGKQWYLPILTTLKSSFKVDVAIADVRYIVRTSVRTRYT